MHRWSLIGFSVVVALLVGCGGGKAPIKGGGNGGGTAIAPMGSVQGRLANSGTRQASFSRFIARVHGTEDKQKLVVQVKADGTFRIDGVPAGWQTLTVENAQGLQGAVIVAFVRPNQVTDVGEIVPQPMGKISGIVAEVDADGNRVKPIARARLIAHPVQTEQETLGDLSERPAFTTFSDDNGSYELLVPPGDYLVEAHHPDYEPAAQTVSVQALSTVPLDFGLHPRPLQVGTVVGTVKAQVNGQLMAVAGALVGLIPKEQPVPQPQPPPPPFLTVGELMSAMQKGKMHPDVLPHRWLFTFTKADGTFELTGVPAGTYTAIAFKRGLGEDRKDITVQANATVTVDFVLQMPVGIVQGQVTDAVTGQPIAGAVIVAVRKGDPWWDWDDWREAEGRKKPHWVRPEEDDHAHPGAPPNFGHLPPTIPPIRDGTITDDNGHYQLLLPPGSYFIAAFARGYQAQAQEVDNLQAGQTVTVNFALTPASAPPPTDLGHLSLRLQVEPQVRAGEKVTMRLKVENKGSQPVTLTFPSGQRYDFVVMTLDRQIVWVWSHGKVFTLAFGTITLSPGQELEFEEEWAQTDNDGNPVRPGTYFVKGILSTQPPRETALQKLVILP
ncbi:MAG: carboxypeptidase regulatory-like domain-containing protein [Armatimonadota bacterium]|nr:carboxypeptidase regulatory-like domain-containing protein [Armatimonadota bacterium]